MNSHANKRPMAVAVLPLALWAVLAAGPADAATKTGSIGVTTSVQATCTVSASTLAFGPYAGAVVNAASAVLITCTNTTPYSIGLNAGIGVGATTTIRKMTGSGGVTINYAIYLDAARSANWGATVGANVSNGVGNGAAQTVTAYGQIPAGQLVTPGAYSDTITATINY